MMKQIKYLFVAAMLAVGANAFCGDPDPKPESFVNKALDWGNSAAKLPGEILDAGFLGAGRPYLKSATVLTAAGLALWKILEKCNVCPGSSDEDEEDGRPARR